MKFTTQEERDAQQRATITGGAKGFLGGLGIALPTSYLFQQRWPYYRALPPSLKAFGVILVAVPSFVISAEKAGIRWERERWTDAGKHEMDSISAREQDRWERMTVGQKAREVMARHQYGFIIGGWALSMVGAWTWIMRSPYQSTTQKVVQARMWAQGLTIGVILGAGALTHANRTSSAGNGEAVVRHLAPDHSWKDIIDQQEQGAKRKE